MVQRSWWLRENVGVMFDSEEGKKKPYKSYICMGLTQYRHIYLEIINFTNTVGPYYKFSCSDMPKAHHPAG